MLIFQCCGICVQLHCNGGRRWAFTSAVNTDAVISSSGAFCMESTVLRGLTSTLKQREATDAQPMLHALCHTRGAGWQQFDRCQMPLRVGAHLDCQARAEGAPRPARGQRAGLRVWVHCSEARSDASRMNYLTRGCGGLLEFQAKQLVVPPPSLSPARPRRRASAWQYRPQRTK